jgi:hypothetical protein
MEVRPEIEPGVEGRPEKTLRVLGTDEPQRFEAMTVIGPPTFPAV